MNTIRFVAGAAIVTLASCGGDGTSANPQPSGDGRRVIEVDMTDIAFSIDTLEVSAGESVEFVFANEGAVDHEALFGDPAAQAAHHAEMQGGAGHDISEMSGTDHGSGHEESAGAHEITVVPGQSIRVEHTFGEAGALEIGCHIPGHWEAGMKIDVSNV